MRIAIFVTRLTFGGLETHIVAFIRELLGQGHQIQLSAEFISDGVKAEFPCEDHSFRVRGWNGDLLDDIREFQPDVIHAHPFHSLIRGYQTAVAMKVPYFITMHGLYDFGVAQPLEAEITREARAIIAVDDGVASCLKQFTSHPEKIITIRNGIDLNYFQPLPLARKVREPYWKHPEWFTISCVSRFENGKEKPILQFLRVAPLLANRLKGLNIILVGDGLCYAEIAEQVNIIDSECRKNICIVLSGKQNDIRFYLAQSDLVMGCDRAALEAMACKKPVLAASAEGYSGLIQHDNYQPILMNRSGYRVFSDRQLVETILEINQSINQSVRHTYQNYLFIREHFDIKTVTRQLVDTYRTNR